MWGLQAIYSPAGLSFLRDLGCLLDQVDPGNTNAKILGIRDTSFLTRFINNLNLGLFFKSPVTSWWWVQSNMNPPQPYSAGLRVETQVSPLIWPEMASGSLRLMVTGAVFVFFKGTITSSFVGEFLPKLTFTTERGIQFGVWRPTMTGFFQTRFKRSLVMRNQSTDHFTFL